MCECVDMISYSGNFADVMVHTRNGSVIAFNNVIDIHLDDDVRVISYIDSNGEMHIADRNVLWDFDVESITINIHKEN